MIEKIADRIWLIDTNMSGRRGYTSVFLAEGDGGAALFDSGVSVTAADILEGVREAGVDPRGLRRIFLSHAHYDHAGGAHELLRLLAEAGAEEVKVACSIKPKVYLGRADVLEKLMRSGLATEGEMAGRMLPMADDRFHVLEDGDEFDLGGVTVKALDSPGHANGHMVFLVRPGDFLFLGDSCGLMGRFKDGAPGLIPTSFAPEYDHEPYLETIGRLRKLSPRLLGFAHYGWTDEPAKVLDMAARSAERMREVARDVEEGKLERDEALDLLEREMGEPAVSLYGDRERSLLTFKTLLKGNRVDLRRKAVPAP